jgi:hypothetical protein
MEPIQRFHGNKEANQIPWNQSLKKKKKIKIIDQHSIMGKK